jgi:glycosyltransferase involved in cell wall biosynthesis
MDRFSLAVFNTQPPHLFFGGVERRIMETAKRLQTESDITVYSGTKAGFRKPISINGVSVVPCYSTDMLFPVDNWFFNRSITKKAAAINADVFEAHAVSGYGFPKSLEKLRIKKPFIHTIHGVLADEYEQAKKNGYLSTRDKVKNYFMERLSKLEDETAKNSTIVVTISNYSLEKIQKYYGIERSKIRIVPNGVDIEKFKPRDNKAARQLFGLGDDEPCVLFVGSLIPRKGLPFLVEAAKKVIKEQADTKFLIVGDGPLRSKLSDSLKSANLLGNFKFIGNLKDDVLPKVYNCSDVFVLPSIQEGQGIVLLEAQASAKPVVAFDIGGINETVQNKETGLLVNSGNADELADALLKLLSDKELREKMGSKGQLFVSENYTWDICSQKMLNVYLEALRT